MLRVRLYFDYVDPGSWLMDRRLGAAVGEGEVRVERLPFELRPPPDRQLDPGDPAWLAYWSGMADAARRDGLELQRPDRVPWTRKAHELALHAGERDRFGAVHDALFRAFLVEGLDLGRVDVLVELARDLGLDHGETKAVLDVDRYAETVERLRSEALEAGIRGVPTIMVEGRRLEGIHPAEAIEAFLAGHDERDTTVRDTPAQDTTEER